MVGFADAGYLSDPHKARSQTGYVFTIGGTVISWRSTQKQTLVATSSNHTETIVLHEACRECVCFRSMSHYIQESSGLVNEKEPTKIFEDISACVAQLKECYIKATEQSISLQDFSHAYRSSREIKKWTSSMYGHPADLFTKALPTTTFRKHVYGIGMQHLRDL